MMKYFIAVLSLLIIIVSCSGLKNENKNLIKEQDMVKILVNFHLSDGISSSQTFVNLYKNDTIQFLDSILKIYGYEHDQFDSTVSYYSNHLDKLEKLYDQVLSTLSRYEGDLLNPRKKK